MTMGRNRPVSRLPWECVAGSVTQRTAQPLLPPCEVDNVHRKHPVWLTRWSRAARTHARNARRLAKQQGTNTTTTATRRNGVSHHDDASADNAARTIQKCIKMVCHERAERTEDGDHNVLRHCVTIWTISRTRHLCVHACVSFYTKCVRVCVCVASMCVTSIG